MRGQYMYVKNKWKNTVEDSAGLQITKPIINCTFKMIKISIFLLLHFILRFSHFSNKIPLRSCSRKEEEFTLPHCWRG